MPYRWMSKSLVLVALLVVALPVMAFAQTSRLEGMTLQGDYVKDYTNIYSYPSQVAGVGNLFYGELGNTFGGGSGIVSDRAVGSVLGNLFEGRMGSWAIHLRQTTPNLGEGDIVSGPNTQDPNINNHEEFDVMWARKVGTMSFGLRLNRSFWGSEVSAPGVQTKLAFDPTTFAAGDTFASRNILGFGGGIGWELGPNTTADIGLLYQSRTFENTTTPVPAGPVPFNSREDSPTTYLLSGRMMWQWQSNIVVTPLLKWYSYDLSIQRVTAAGTQTSENTLKGWQFGAAANWSLGSNDMLVWGVDFIRNRVEQVDPLFGPANTDITETMLPRLFAALETHVNSWLTVRMGASKGAFAKVKTEPRVSGGTTTETTGTSFDMNIGAGVKLGTLQLDAVLADNTFQYSNGLLGGLTPAGGFFPKVTATYSF